MTAERQALAMAERVGADHLLPVGLTYRGRVLEAMTAPGLGIGGLAPGSAARELTS